MYKNICQTQTVAPIISAHPQPQFTCSSGGTRSQVELADLATAVPGVLHQ